MQRRRLSQAKGDMVNKTAKKAENHVKRYFRNNYKLEGPGRGEAGFDFRDPKSRIFIEVKGSEKKKLSDVLFRSFSNAQYEKAKECLRNQKLYEIHLVLGIGTQSVEHYCIPAKVFIEKAKPAISWSLPIRKEIKEYKVDV